MKLLNFFKRVKKQTGHQIKYKKDGVCIVSTRKQKLLGTIILHKYKGKLNKIRIISDFDRGHRGKGKSDVRTVFRYLGVIIK